MKLKFTVQENHNQLATNINITNGHPVNSNYCVCMEYEYLSIDLQRVRGQ